MSSAHSGSEHDGRRSTGLRRRGRLPVQVNRLEVNATINLLRERGLLPADYRAPLEVDDLIAHVYDACARNGVGAAALRREVAAILRECESKKIT